MTEREQLEAWLKEAQLAYHQLNMGQRTKVYVDQNGERVEYEGASRGQLLAYINELKRQLGLVIVTGPSTLII